MKREKKGGRKEVEMYVHEEVEVVGEKNWMGMYVQ